ncbi:hypothetical protein BDM02DRAFT_3149779 [Thelephora ganbajun]|uniref:Uncharacterized protein n=1 Tax=Thelephora ganbajun TaxID=370292 RepID=A0ACB6Z5E6_THEGA|nr:hypothetical protein BDM02DRAFT_3149779 [Thelephora ganbajun]
MFAPVDSKLPPKVLVVGAGPAGLVLALSLLQNGVPVRIIDKAQKHPVGQRGSGIQPRSMELYRTLGVLDDILREHIPVPEIRTCELGSGFSQVISVFNTSPYMVPTPECPYLNPILLGQSRTQGILRNHLKRLGREVELGTELVDIEQNNDYVTCRLKKTRADGSVEDETLKIDYVVGVDGGRGFVRKKMGFTFLGETRHGEHWVIADVRIKDLGKNYWHMWGDFQNTLLMIRPTDDAVNDEFWVAIAGSDIDWQKLSTSPGHFIHGVRKLSGLHSLEFSEVMTLNYYQINIRMTDSFGRGRVFIAGDAAHAHPFIGGQGMNTSIQDSFNLGWKLALATKSLASPRLLDSYSTERLPVIAKMLELTKELLNKTVELDPHSDTPEEDSPYHRGLKLYQLDINCRGSPIVVDGLDKKSYKLGKRLRAGDRAPDAPGIIPLNTGLQPGTTQLFDIFSSNRHVALIFVEGNENVKPYLELLKHYPPDTVLPVIVLQRGDERNVDVFGKTNVVQDSTGHAWKNYSAEHGTKITIVRPDGCVGALGCSPGVMEEYRNLVFGTSASSKAVFHPARARL